LIANIAGQLGGVMQGVAKMAPGGGDIGSQADIAADWDQVGQSIKAAGDQANNFSDIAQKLDKEFEGTRTRIWSDQAPQTSTTKTRRRSSFEKPLANPPTALVTTASTATTALCAVRSSSVGGLITLASGMVT
jgi:hypothetical protein